MKKLFIILIWLRCISLSGATYYVATTGSDGAAGTFAAPWKTWQYAFNELTAGDTLFVRGGTYTDMYGYYAGTYFGARVRSDTDGTSSDHIVIMNYPGESPVLDCSTLISPTETHHGLAFDGCSYIDITGLTVINVPENTNEVIYNYANGIILMDCNHITFTRCVAHNIEGSGFSLGGSNDYIYYTNCDAYKLADHSDNGGYANGFSCNIGVDNHVFYDGCRAWSCSDDGWDSYGGAGFIEINNCWSFSNGTWDGETGNGAGFKTGANTRNTDESGTQRKITNCLSFYNAGISGIAYDESQDGTTGYAMQHEIYNCVSYNNLAGFNFGYGTGKNGSTATDYIKNCISYSDDDPDNGWGSNVVTYNSWNTPPGVTVADADFLSVDTTGVTGARQSNGDLPNLNFFKLEGSSDLIDAGTDVQIAYNGDAPDLGAFEYGTINTPPTVTTTAITGVGTTSATSGGNVTDDGGEAVTARGVCWSTSNNPTISNNHTHDGTGTGVFVSSITSLETTTTYYVRAYATNSIGTDYGDIKTFTTGTASKGSELIEHSGVLVIYNNRLIKTE